MTTSMRAVTVQAPGKVNVGFSVGGLRSDGYHEVATLLIALSHRDLVTIQPARGLRLTVSGPTSGQVPEDESNLAAQAALRLAKFRGIRPDVHIRIRKNIPSCGGMAGGSADAAATLIACNTVWGTGLKADELAALAAELGADVPFCLIGGAAVGRGRGEVLEPLSAAGPYHWAIAFSDRGLSTPAMFTALDERRAAARSSTTPAALPDELLHAFASGDPRRLASVMFNDFEQAAMEEYPALRKTREAGLNAGALTGILSGTGATYAFLAESEAAAHSVAEKLRTLSTCAAVHVVHGPVPGPRLLSTSR